ncbi:MAG: BsuBI/PstI family type II restriction endonuclease [Burkholderiaceae bacterium]|nr:BsuBI/PstI family type II restriction endonuclease [Burkholderiaceae bacterium]
MTLPSLLPIHEIRKRLEIIFPEGLVSRSKLVSEMAARVCYVFLYGGMLEGAGRLLRPSHVYFFTAEQSSKVDAVSREHWFIHATKPKFRPSGSRWYADTTREAIRDDTIRLGLREIGAVGAIPGFAVTTPSPVYFLEADFAALLHPSLTDDAFEAAASAWRERHLTPAAKVRAKLLAGGKVKKSDAVLVTCPDGSVATLSAGPSSVIAKAVVEQFACEFLPNPALLWLSESGSKVRHQDQAAASDLGLKIDAAKVLPDIILVNVGQSGKDTALVFVEVVASDGAMTESRRQALLNYVHESGFPADQCFFVTAFEDRADGAFRKCLPQLAWGTFAWFRTEPQCLIWLAAEPFDVTRRASDARSP